MIQGHSSADQELPCCYETYRFKTTIYKNTPVDQVQSQLNRFHTLTFSLFKIYFNIILLSTFLSPNVKFIVNSPFSGGWDMVHGVTSSHWVSRQSQWSSVGLCNRLGPVFIDVGYSHISSNSTGQLPGGLQSVTGMLCSAQHSISSANQQIRNVKKVHLRVCTVITINTETSTLLNHKSDSSLVKCHSLLVIPLWSRLPQLRLQTEIHTPWVPLSEFQSYSATSMIMIIYKIYKQILVITSTHNVQKWLKYIIFKPNV